MFSIAITQSGLEEVFATMRTLQRAVEDPILFAKDDLVAWFRSFEKRQFASEGGAGQSGKWAPLSPPYARWKARRYPGTTILIRTGRLMRSLTGQTADSIIEVQRRKLVLGSSVPYGGFHQRGEGQKRRSPIDITNRDAAEVVSIIRRRLFAEIEKGQKVAA